MAIASTKLSILALYYRVFISPGTPYFRFAVHVTVGFVLAWIVVLEIVLGFECRPIQAWWGAASGTCLDTVAVGFFTNSTNMALDIWIFAMPIPTLLNMLASRSEKIRLCFLFSLGLATCSISAARLAVVGPAFSSKDVTCKPTLEPLGMIKVLR